MPLAAINELPEHELALWMVRGPLWPRRFEMLLIQLTTVLSRGNGNKTNMNDFDLFKKTVSMLDEASNDIGMVAGVGVRKLGQGRK